MANFFESSCAIIIFFRCARVIPSVEMREDRHVLMHGTEEIILEKRSKSFRNHESSDNIFKRANES
jgi:hypothetical protein